MAADVLIVSLGATAGLRRADEELADSIRRAGISAETSTAARPRELRTYALGDLAYARNARRAALEGIEAHSPRAIVYSSTTAAALWPRPGAIRFDAPAAGNRPGRHGLWQRPVERRRFRQAPLLLPWSEGGLAEAPAPHAGALVLPVGVEPSGDPAPDRDLAAITYAAHPEKKGTDRVLDAWKETRRDDETLVVVGAERGMQKRAPSPNLRKKGDGALFFTGLLEAAEYRALLRRARIFVTAPRREDYGIAQLEALADGCLLVTTPAPGPYAALPLARALDPRLVVEEPSPAALARAIRTALDDPAPEYATRAHELLAPFRPEAIDPLVADQLLPRLLA